MIFSFFPCKPQLYQKRNHFVVIFKKSTLKWIDKRRWRSFRLWSTWLCKRSDNGDIKSTGMEVKKLSVWTQKWGNFIILAQVHSRTTRIIFRELAPVYKPQTYLKHCQFTFVDTLTYVRTRASIWRATNGIPGVSCCSVVLGVHSWISGWQVRIWGRPIHLNKRVKSDPPPTWQECSSVERA